MHNNITSFVVLRQYRRRACIYLRFAMFWFKKACALKAVGRRINVYLNDANMHLNCSFKIDITLTKCNHCASCFKRGKFQLILTALAFQKGCHSNNTIWFNRHFFSCTIFSMANNSMQRSIDPQCHVIESFSVWVRLLKVRGILLSFRVLCFMQMFFASVEWSLGNALISTTVNYIISYRRHRQNCRKFPLNVLTVWLSCVLKQHWRVEAICRRIFTSRNTFSNVKDAPPRATLTVVNQSRRHAENRPCALPCKNKKNAFIRLS